MPTHSRRHGFTLLEFAIVLTIIALLVGGLMVGQSLVRSAQLKQVLSEYDTYMRAISDFQTRYQALPGDFSRATSLWGEEDPGNCNTTVSSGRATCNGNGDGRIGSANQDGTVSNVQEWFLAWEHLTSALLMEGRYNGSGTDLADAELVVNIPASQVGGAGWMLGYYENTGLTSDMWAKRYFGHVLRFGSLASGGTTGGAISPQEALEIDEKIDDGRPGTGNVMSWRNAGCINDNTNAESATYNTAISEPGCALLFITGY